MAKMFLPDNSPQNKKRMVAASGGYQTGNVVSSSKVVNNFAHSVTANIPITKNAQYAGAGANVAWTQPMFFSPLHTPQNWQIASRRREIMQWARFYYCFTPENLILMSDGTEKKISDINIGDMIVNGEGGNSIVKNVHSRNISENILKIRIDKWINRSRENIKVTQFHEIPRITQEEWDLYQNNSINSEEIKQLLNDKNKWGPAETLCIGDRLFFYDYEIENKYSFTTIEDISNENYTGLVYDIETDDPHSYCVNRCIVHNSNEPKVAAGVDFYCFEPSTQILMADGTQKSIDSIKRGDIVRSHDGTNNPVTRKHRRETSEEMLKITISGLSNASLKTTKGHKILIRDGDNYKYVLAEDLKIGDYLLTPYICQNGINIPDEEENFIIRRIISIEKYDYEGKVYDLTIKNTHSYIAEGVAVSNSNFSMNGFKLECKSRKILKFYERLVDKLDLAEKLNAISHEYFLLGDVFPFTEIQCPVCHGSNRSKDGEICNHPDGTFKTIKLMNPDYIDVKDNPIASNPEFFLIPDEELKMLVTRKEPRSVYNALPKSLIDLVSSGQPIPLSARCISHLKHNASDYGTYGTSMLQRLFTVLAYKTKIMTANWIVAERLILPVRVVKVGDKDRPATDADLQDVQNQLSAVANDPNLTIVTHHAFEYEWYGSTGKIHNITQEMELIGKEILDGLMLNQAILNGEMCIPETDLTLTKEGFKSLDEITPNDYMGTYNIETGCIEYQKYSEKHVYDFDGDLCLFRSNRIDFACTPNHKMLFQKRDHNEWIVDEAQNVKDRSKFVKQVKWMGKDYDSVIVGDSEINIDMYVRLVAYYVTEGYLNKWKRKVGNREKVVSGVAICQTKKGKAYDDISCLMEELSSSLNCTYRSNEWEFVLNNKCLAEYLQLECGEYSRNKRLPQWIKDLPPKRLKLLLMSMIDGDGSIRTRDRGTKKQYYTYYTNNIGLANDVLDVALKCGYWPKIRSRRNIYEVNFSDYDLGKKSIALESKKYENTVDSLRYKGRVYCFTVPNHYIITMRNGKLMISHNSGYTSAQVGIEVLIRRLDNWRNKLKEWVEKHIFKPVAMMQGFIDEEESKLVGETVYLYPTLTWNDLQLRDKTNRIQTIVQIYDKGLVSAQTLLEEMDLDYDSEVEKIREEQIMAQANGMVAGGKGGGGAGAMGMGGGLGGGAGVPPDIGGEGLGGGMMGAPGGAPGGMQGAPGGAPGGAPIAPGGGGVPGMGAAASGSAPYIGRRGSKNKQQEEAEKTPPPKMIKLTKLEQKMFKALTSLDIPHELFAQYEVRVPGESRPYAIDFAYPKIGVGVEVDGAIWHERPDFQQRDLNRDHNLSNIGWRILRFNEEAIDEKIDAVSEVISKHIEEAAKQTKAAEENNKVIKQASSEEIWKNPQYEFCLTNGEIGCKRGHIPQGKILYIGNIVNE